MAESTMLRVTASGQTYPVMVLRPGERLDGFLGDAAKIVIVSNATVFALHGPEFIRSWLPSGREVIPVMMGDGERYKTRATVNRLYEHFFAVGLGRRDTVIALGGGVVGDTAGFAAATFKRGVGLIQAPTTLLSMVDSSIGGKVGVNHGRGKNLIGAFYQPRAVAVNPLWLATLGRREIVGGLAEIIKTGFISSRTFLRRTLVVDPLAAPPDVPVLFELVRQAMKFKVAVVKKDTHDNGRRMMLNFGHTFGHAIEQAEGHNRYRHGEAVLAGMAGAVYLSHAGGRMRKVVRDKALGYLEPYMRFAAPLKKPAEDYFHPMSVDKKSNNGNLTFVLLDDVGRPRVATVLSRAKILDAIERMKDFVNSRGRS